MKIDLYKMHKAGRINNSNRVYSTVTFSILMLVDLDTLLPLTYIRYVLQIYLNELQRFSRAVKVLG